MKFLIIINSNFAIFSFSKTKCHSINTIDIIVGTRLMNPVLRKNNSTITNIRKKLNNTHDNNRLLTLSRNTITNHCTSIFTNIFYINTVKFFAPTRKFDFSIINIIIIVFTNLTISKFIIRSSIFSCFPTTKTKIGNLCGVPTRHTLTSNLTIKNTVNKIFYLIRNTIKIHWITRITILISSKKIKSIFICAITSSILASKFQKSFVIKTKNVTLFVKLKIAIRIKRNIKQSTSVSKRSIYIRNNITENSLFKSTTSSIIRNIIKKLLINLNTYFILFIFKMRRNFLLTIKISILIRFFILISISNKPLELSIS